MISNFIIKKMTDITLNNEKFKENWAIHEQVFGPILTPAFVDYPQARIQLTAALNALMTKDVKHCLKKLKQIQKYRVTNADYAAWLYFMGLCDEVTGNRYGMISFYSESGKYGHRFYLPYLKLAKCAYEDCIYELSEDNYRLAIRSLKETELDEQRMEILASAYTNLAACLTMMHKHEEAQAAFAASEKTQAVQKGRSAPKAVLYAAMGKKDSAEKCLSVLPAEAPELLDETRNVVEEILNQKNPHFAVFPVEITQAEAFWNWFRSQERFLRKKIEEQDLEIFFSMMMEELQKLFPFIERDVELSVLPEDGFTSCSIQFADFFSVSVRAGYELLLNICPDELKDYWKFEIVH